jgi:ABC-2 type transport system ATP-binding protein
MVGIEARGLEKSFGGVRALRGITLAFEPGLLHGIIGPAGAGKTTLMRTIIGLLKPDEGEVAFTLEGRPAGLGEIRAHAAYMPQRPSLYPDLSVREHLEFFRDLYRLPPETYRERSARLLGLARLEKFQERRAGRLSGGMYKKLGLMAALLRSPKALLLDEPTNGVDPISRRELWVMLHGLAAEGITILVSTAYMDEAERCARVHLLESGRLLASGEPRAILAERGAGGLEELFIRETGA